MSVADVLRKQGSPIGRKSSAKRTLNLGGGRTLVTAVWHGIGVRPEPWCPVRVSPGVDVRECAGCPTGSTALAFAQVIDVVRRHGSGGTGECSQPVDGGTSPERVGAARDAGGGPGPVAGVLRERPAAVSGLPDRPGRVPARVDGPAAWRRPLRNAAADAGRPALTVHLSTVRG